MLQNGSCVRLRTRGDERAILNIDQPHRSEEAKARQLNTNIKPRTESERNNHLQTISSSQKGKSLVWYKFTDWTHPYYHKSEGQRALDTVVKDLTPYWNQPVKRPTTTYGQYTGIYRPPRKHEPIGAGYEAVAELDYHQPRQAYSRYTLPDPQKTSLHTLQNPLERRRPIPCLRDQRIFSNGYHSYNLAGSMALSRAVKDNQLTSDKTMQCIEGAAVTGVRNEKVEFNIPTAGLKTSNGAGKRVSWADQVTNSKENSRPASDAGNQNRNNNADNCIKDVACSQSTGLIRKPPGEDNTSFSNPVADQLRVIKGGRYYHYLDTNSQQCVDDVPTNYCSEEDDIVYNFVKNDAEDYNTEESEECSQMQRMRYLEATDQLNYPYKRRIPGYSGHMPEHTPDLPLIKPSAGASIPFHQTSYRDIFCRNVPESEYKRARTSKGRKAPMSGQITLIHPFNPFTTEREKLLRHTNSGEKKKQRKSSCNKQQ